MQYDAIIVGAGIFGSVINKALSNAGMSCLVIDDRRENAGSKPAACLMKPSWFSSLGKEVHEPSLRLLDELYGVRDLQFKVGVGTATVHWVPPTQILSTNFHRGKVTQLGRNYVKLQDGLQFFARNIILAAGVWTDLLVDMPKMLGRAGCAFTWSGHLGRAFISPWAPYRQLVGFDRAPGEIWVGDGSAIKPENWTQERQQISLERCSKIAHLPALAATPLYGIRPYTSAMKPCYFTRVGTSNTWVATGGAKNGTLAAGWCAHRLLEALT